jgi:hypothetical protein
MSSKLPLVVVVWDDAWKSATTDVTVKDVTDHHKAAVMQTLGWLLKEDATGVSVANERCMDDGDEAYRGVTFIPRGMVRSITPFNLSRPRKSRAKVQPPPPA